jgi:hypothetical protein
MASIGIGGIGIGKQRTSNINIIDNNKKIIKLNILFWLLLMEKKQD